MKKREGGEEQIKILEERITELKARIELIWNLTTEEQNKIFEKKKPNWKAMSCQIVEECAAAISLDDYLAFEENKNKGGSK